MKIKEIIVGGKRKTAVAKAAIRDGNGKVLNNKKDYKDLEELRRLMIEEPLRIAERVLGGLNFDIIVNVSGGGNESQIESARQAIARALVKITKSVKLEREFIRYDRSLIVSDVRRKEAYKPGDSKARANRQSSKR